MAKIEGMPDLCPFFITLEADVHFKFPMICNSCLPALLQPKKMGKDQTSKHLSKLPKEYVTSKTGKKNLYSRGNMTNLLGVEGYTQPTIPHWRQHMTFLQG
jgi:hypothetical protein